LLQNLAGVDRLDVLIALMLVGFGFLGLVVPATSVLALDDHGAIAGTASALMGTLQFVVGAIVMAVVGQFVDGTAFPMVLGIAASAVASLAIAKATLR
jgi:DHA1 family bicyclomycin/chloramphenicol resistance-like MFS transporter